MVQRGRVELHELHVADRHAGAQRHGHAVSGRFGRIGGDAEELARATGGQDDVVGPYFDWLVRARWERGHPDATASFDDEVECEPRLEHGAGRAPGGRDESAFDLGPGRRPSGVDHASARVASFARQGEQPGRLAVELDTERDQFVDPPWALVDENAHRLFVADPGARREGVGQVQVGRIFVATEHGGDSPWAQRVADCDSAPLVSTPSDKAGGAPGSASRTAAVRPATPLPRTRTSKGPGPWALPVTPVRSARARHRGAPTPRRSRGWPGPRAPHGARTSRARPARSRRS